MFPYAHRSKTTKTKTRPGTTLDDAIRTDLQQVLLPLYIQRLQRYEQQENGMGMGISTVSVSTSAYATVFLPLFIETKMGLLLRRQSIVPRTTSKNVTNNESNESNENNNENATTAVVDVATASGHNGHKQRKRGGGRINNSSSTKSPRRSTNTSSTNTSTKYYGFMPSQRCDLHSYIQFVFSVVQDEIQNCLFRQPGLSLSLETDTSVATGNCVYTISFYIFAFYTLIQILHPPPPLSSKSSTKYTTFASTGDRDKSSNGDSILSHLSMGVQSYDNPKVVYRRMYHQYTRIRMTIQFYNLIVQLLMKTQQQLSNSSYHVHSTNARQSVIYTVRTDIKLILLRLIDNTAQYFDLASYHGSCNLEGYTWQRHHAPVVPNAATNYQNMVAPVNEEAARMENAAMDESISPYDENNCTSGTSSTIHRAIKAHLQSTSTFDRMSDGSGDSNPLQHLLLKYYSGYSIPVSSKNPSHDNVNNGIDSDVVNIPAVNTTNRNDWATALTTKTSINPTHICDPVGDGGGVSQSACEHAEGLVWNGSDEDYNDNGEVSKSFTSRTIEAANGDDHDSIVSTTSSLNNGNNIGQMALSKLLQHVTHQTQSPQPRRPSKFTYGDFFLLQEQPDLDDNGGDAATTIVSTQKQQKHDTKQVRKGSKAEHNKTTKVAKKHKPKKMLPSPSMVLVGDDSMFRYQSSIGDDKVGEDDNANVELDDDDDDDSLTDEFAIATTGHDALSKLLLLARPK